MNSSDAHIRHRFDYLKRQESVFRKMNRASMMILIANPISFRSHDTDYPYRPNSNILYLSGFEEPESVLVLLKTVSQDNENEKSKMNFEQKTILFVQPKDPEKETWTGRRLGPELAKRLYHVTEVFENTHFSEWFKEHFENISTFYCRLNQFKKGIDEQIIELFAKTPYITIQNPLKLLGEIRTIKDNVEIDLMKKSAKIASDSHVTAMKYITPNMPEIDLQHLFSHEFRSKGATGEAYNSIIASGDNATILHYVKNNSVCKDGDLILIDAGCEFQYYASDITRTYPVNGKFTEFQKKIYNIVLEAQKIAINLCQAGNTWDQINKATIKSLTEGLVTLGILKGNTEKLIDEEKYKPFFMHSFGHSLGLDTHDPSNLRIVEDGEKKYYELRPGTIITVEPGLYFSSTLEKIPEEFKGIGVRIEDDVLITENGPVILTESVPKEVDEIELLMNNEGERIN
jgi:Xaa-Pro aminopeptidase